MIDSGALRRAFMELYGREPRVFRAPGRVNLIGEHTDYNDGYVLPMAIDRDAGVAGAARADRRVRVKSLNQHEAYEFNLDEPGARMRGLWLDYIEGVAHALEERGLRLSGADLLISSDVPAGAGLSSSAALEVATGLAFASLSGVEIDRVSLALAGQHAEHVYVGTKCGIMDQLIAALGRENHALLIDCRSLEVTPIPFESPQLVVAICDTRVKHKLSSSEYNTRREECERGVQILKEWLPRISALRDVSAADLQRYEDRLPETIRRRCRHVITENQRTLRAAAALGRGDLEEMGELMNRSHTSLRDDYQVSCFELDLMVEIAGRFDAVLGARMTGGGFGGCTVNLLRRDALEEFSQTISSQYAKETSIDPAIYVSAASDGAREVRMSD